MTRYLFSVFQQAISAVSTISESPRRVFHFRFDADNVPISDADCYELSTGCYAVYGFEYKPGFVDDNAVHTFSPALAPVNHQLMRPFLSSTVHHLGRQ